MTISLRVKHIIYVSKDQFFTRGLHLFAFKRIFYANSVFKNCGDQEVKLGHRILFVLKHLEIFTKKKNLKYLFSYLFYIGNIKFKIGTRKALI